LRGAGNGAQRDGRQSQDCATPGSAVQQNAPGRACSGRRGRGFRVDRAPLRGLAVNATLSQNGLNG